MYASGLWDSAQLIRSKDRQTRRGRAGHKDRQRQAGK